MPRGSSFRSRVRGAAGVRPFRSYGLNANRPIAYKPSEVAMAGPPPLYGQYSPNKMGKMSEKGEQYSHDYMFLPMAPSAEGMETPIAVTGPPLMSHGPHARVAHPYMYPPHPGYDEMAYFAYVPGPLPGF
ncbi:APOBEC1 complementation factor [Trichonephila clavata]|uniref:APOBEC1 complementation factor n=1 Tax=Trichonephila clavata TaxID=2740835 RepID=A0A8X6LUZ8_TRICU|nr:APOBEC1 complementation factor [Trichonephila clavata]